MSVRFLFGALGALAFFMGTLSVDGMANAASRGEMDSASPVTTISSEELKEMVDQSVKEELDKIMNRQPQGPTDFSQPPTGTADVNIRGLGQTNQSQQRIRQGAGDWVTGGSVLEGGRTVYAKPFVRAPKTIVGGYIDFTISDCNNANARDCREGLEFDQERFVPFFYSQVTDRLSVAAEVEIEHGGPQGNQDDGDVKIEFATMDYRFTDWLNLRGGIILIPMGRFNLIHDSPLNDLPLRPMVSRLIIPSTLGESGIGFFGTFYPTQLSKVDYEIYVTQGFKGENSDGSTSITEGSGLRSARGSIQTDNNENKAIVSRISVSPLLGIEVAGSVHHGKWDNDGDCTMTIWAVDGLLQRGPFELQGEAAWVKVRGGHNPPDTGNGVPPEKMAGYYVQGNYHFMPDFLRQAAPSFFGESSTFTGVIRWGEADTNTQSSDNVNDLSRLTLGINFRPVEDSVIKFAYTWNDHEDSPGSRNGWQFNMSTYF